MRSSEKEFASEEASSASERLRGTVSVSSARRPCLARS